MEGCGYDALSILELSRQRITVANSKQAIRSRSSLTTNLAREIVTSACWRWFHRLLLQPGRLKPAVAARPAFDLPHGDRTISGVIIRRDARSITLRTREGEQTLLLRKDTRYLGDGAPAGCRRSLVNTRVFVRAGPNLDGGIEAYQVMWGEIVDVQ